ncbi:hypothetical protein QTQ03_08505 [Micromonospora sp. WMMA1363]|uniref:hypothetical protein n=1 Tax=Micromonospora sp. WMMA1363 TaxID=3053985 RepID=UPI00259CE107|nr:hypothetical protein [Micromonospora sp. WMMA1363]MDM4719623.1 hypothetical protein [Micromonospora sp. WMMA1363]
MATVRVTRAHDTDWRPGSLREVSRRHATTLGLDEAAARDSRRACPSFTPDESSVALRFDVRAAPPPPSIGEFSWRSDSTMNATTAGHPFTGTSAYVMLVAGYTIVTVYLSAQLEPLHEDPLEPLDEDQFQRVLATTEHTPLHLP